ncbi:hypothetical protein [Alicyclobacillus acidiphilus]|uniref:hypothetical protein n=1 Tax=Alicyclobacillus acidiphilus TaxID=182455 RepID=UPI00082B3D6A|nr:hypothetical protein [Alicyclobacillus acidiphilus]
MPKHPRSLNAQTALTDASNSLNKAEHAVRQAQSHPDDTTVAQAENALQKADHAVDTIQESENQIAVESLNRRYTQAASNLAAAEETAEDSNDQ